MVDAQTPVEDHREEGTASHFVDHTFPGGVTPIIHRSYPELAAEAERLAARMKRDSGPALEALGVRRLTDQLAESAAAFSVAITDYQMREIDGSRLVADHHHGNALLRGTLARVLGRYPHDTPQDMAGRLRLISPVLRQHDRVSEAFRSRRSVGDVDPDSGQELDPTEVDEGLDAIPPSDVLT